MMFKRIMIFFVVCCLVGAGLYAMDDKLSRGMYFAKLAKDVIMSRTTLRVIASFAAAGVTFKCVDDAMENNDSIKTAASFVSGGRPGLVKVACAGAAGGGMWYYMGRDLHKEIKECRESVEAVDAKISNLGEELAETRKDLSGVDERLAAVQGSVGDIKEQVTGAQLSIARLDDHIGAIATDVVEIKKRLEEHDAHWKTLMPMVGEHGDQLKGLQEKFDGEATAAEQQRVLVRQQLGGLASKSTSIEAKIDHIAAAVDPRDSRKGGLQSNARIAH